MLTKWLYFVITGGWEKLYVNITSTITDRKLTIKMIA